MSSEDLRPEAVWWHTAQGPLVGLVPASRLDSPQREHRGELKWYIAVLTPTRPAPSQDVAEHWRLDQLKVHKKYGTAEARFHKILQRCGGPARRASSAPLPPRTGGSVDRLLMRIWQRLLRLLGRG